MLLFVFLEGGGYEEKVHIGRQEGSYLGNPKGETITAAIAQVRYGAFWTVIFVSADGKRRLLGTRCKWDTVMKYVSEYADCRYYSSDKTVCRFVKELKVVLKKREEEYRKAGNMDKAKSYYSCMQIVDNLLHGRM